MKCCQLVTKYNQVMADFDLTSRPVCLYVSLSTDSNIMVGSRTASLRTQNRLGLLLLLFPFTDDFFCLSVKLRIISDCLYLCGLLAL